MALNKINFNDQIAISIIIPTFNASFNIQALIRNINVQAFKNFELVIIDNLSTDETLSIIKNNFEDHSRLQILSEKDYGIYDAMNKGIALARGAWIYFMGADDRFTNSDVLKNISNDLTEDQDIVYGNVIWIPSNKKEEGEWGYQKLLNQNINHQRIFCRKVALLKAGGFNTKFKVYSDYDLNIRLFCDPSFKKHYVVMDITYFNATGFSSDKVDEVFWDDWESIIKKNFKPHLKKVKIYGSLKRYYWYQLNNENYRKAFSLFVRILVYTRSFGFVKSNIAYTVKKFKGKHTNFSFL